MHRERLEEKGGTRANFRTIHEVEVYDFFIIREREEAKSKLNPFFRKSNRKAYFGGFNLLR